MIKSISFKKIHKNLVEAKTCTKFLYRRQFRTNFCLHQIFMYFLKKWTFVVTKKCYNSNTIKINSFYLYCSNNGCSMTSSASSASTTSNHATSSLPCPTCIAFSDHCCQQENGLILFDEFIEANMHCCVWEQRLSDALASLR